MYLKKDIQGTKLDKGTLTMCKRAYKIVHEKDCRIRLDNFRVLVATGERRPKQIDWMPRN
jgi:hypothetical protein